MNGTPLPPKKEVALALLERGSVHVHLDPRAGGVVVPAWFKRQPQLVLQVGLNMPVPIPDLRVDEDGLSCTLSFNRSPFFCIVPWSAVFAMVGDDSRGMVWPDDVPPEVATQARAREAEPAAKKPAPPRALASVKPPPDTPLHVAAPKTAASKPSAKASATLGAKASAKPRAVRAEEAAPAKTKKPRAKKPSTGAVAMAPEATAPAKPGRLISIPSGKAPSGKAPGAQPPATTPAPTARPAPAKQPSPVAQPARSAPQASAPSTAPAPSPSPARMPTGNKTGGKTKREIPPYLRVVK
jgi:stringent starvation protein B